MAIQNSPLKKASLFSPELFADPETLSQISQVENPPPPAPPPPAAMDQIPMRGAVPQSFTEWAIDPMNLSKIAPPAPRNTPMPSVVAQKAAAAADAGFLKPVTTAPPIESSKPQPSLEDSLMAPAPGSSVIKGPPSRQDFFASLPGGHAAIPGPPPSYQGKKLAAMGLFTALDTIGAALTHGEPTVGPGLIRNAQALAEYKRSLPATQTAADTAAYEQSLKEGGLVNAQTKTPVTIQGPNGPMTIMADPATLKTLLPAQAKAQGTVESAKIGAQSRMDVKQLELQIQQGQISKMVPGINPANGQPQYEAFNKAGKSLGFVDHSVVPGLIARTSSTVEYKEDGDGNLHALPKTTVSAPALPGGAGNKISGPPKVTPASPGAITQQPAVPAQPKPAPTGTAPSGGGRVVPGFLGKSANQMMVGTDETGKQIAGTPAELRSAGVSNITKLGSGEADKVNIARQLTSPGGLFDLIDKDTQQFKPGELEGIGPRWNEFLAGTVGAGDPRYVALRTHLNGLLSTALMQAHVGARGGEHIMEHFQDLANAGKMSLPTVKAALEAEKQYVNEKAMRPSAKTTKGTNKSNDPLGIL